MEIHFTIQRYHWSLESFAKTRLHGGRASLAQDRVGKAMHFITAAQIQKNIIRKAVVMTPPRHISSSSDLWLTQSRYWDDLNTSETEFTFEDELTRGRSYWRWSDWIRIVHIHQVPLALMRKDTKHLRMTTPGRGASTEAPQA